MIESISIQNFRCYRNTQIKGFKRLNLIGGLNNAGKTVLLEAIYLNTFPNAEKFLSLKRIRGEFDVSEYPDLAWDDYFYNYLYENIIIISTPKNSIRIDCKKSNIESIYSESHSEFSTLSICEDEENLPFFTIKATKAEYVPEYILKSKKSFTKSFYITTKPVRANRLADNFSLTQKNDQEDLVIRGLQIIDAKIEKIRISTINGAHLELKREGEPYINVSLFGDALNKALNIILTIINNKSAILLIDEVENGLHHTVQRDFWKFIFTLSQPKYFDIQLFATTHSLEMLRAFKDVALTEFSEDAAYIELFLREKGAEKQEIHYNLHKMDTLDFEINSQIPVRGE
jgi:AAA15 family ATPase/GTPase